jgi:hypothetical protein
MPTFWHPSGMRGAFLHLLTGGVGPTGLNRRLPSGNPAEFLRHELAVFKERRIDLLDFDHASHSLKQFFLDDHVCDLCFGIFDSNGLLAGLFDLSSLFRCQWRHMDLVTRKRASHAPESTKNHGPPRADNDEVLYESRDVDHGQARNIGGLQQFFIGGNKSS